MEFLTANGLILATFVFGGFCARATGVGFALLAFTILLADPRFDGPTALLIIAFPSLFNLSIALVQTHRGLPWAAMRAFAVPMIMGTVLGFIFSFLVAKLWLIVLGLIVIGFSLWTLFGSKPMTQRGFMAHPWAGGGLGGFMTGSLAFPGPPVSAYLLGRGLIGDAVRSTIAVIGLVMSVTRIGVTLPMTPSLSSLFPLITTGCVAVVCGVFIGQVWAKSMTAKTQKWLIFAITTIALVQLFIALIREVYGV